MKEKEGLVIKVESGVAPPSEMKKKGVSKYDPVQEIIDKAAFNEWHRIQLPDTKAANGAKAHFRKKEKDNQLDYLLLSSVKSSGDVAWFYFRKEVIAEGQKLNKSA